MPALAMNPALGESKQAAVERFWAAYRSCVEQNRVNPKHAGFYVGWAQRFVEYQPDKRLTQRTGQDVELFLQSLAKQPHIEAWQVKQAEQALKILYEQFLPNYRPTETRTDSGAPGGRALPLGRAADSTPSGRFRDRVLPGEVERRWPELLQALVKELRNRHYSYRTEQAYVDWLRRFIAFHGYRDPHGFDAAAVREYLDYLATTREVAASTQNQALNALVFAYGQVWQQPLGEFGDFERAKRPQRVPQVMSREEVTALLAQMSGDTALMAGLLYGAGMRLMECVRLRVKDLDCRENDLTASRLTRLRPAADLCPRWQRTEGPHHDVARTVRRAVERAPRARENETRCGRGVGPW